MEVSSEALLHKRLDNIKYNVGILTNITEDHLNIHKNIDDYVNSKALLFKKIKKIFESYLAGMSFLFSDLSMNGCML